MRIQSQSKRQLFLISAGLVLLIAVSFEPLRHNYFITYDDDFYITENNHIQAGFTRDSVIWAFTSGYQANWHPLTWLSHMADIELFGLNPLGHHLHNLLLHTLSTLLLFWLLYRMTGVIWPSAFAAIAFGIHPLRVESVAWAAERKDVLCVLFWMLTTAAYLAYIKRGGVLRYLLVVVCFAMGLMTKPMLVTLPIVLLLLDLWPLGRIQRTCDKKQKHSYCNQSFRGLLAEKIPLFILVFISCAVTYLVQQHKGSVDDISPLTYRIANALTGYVNYLGKIVWPANLAVLYPYADKGFTWWKTIIMILGLAAVSGFTLHRFGKQPWLAAGWFWYVITLIPVIGLVQVGIQAMADRYTYLPSIGIFIILAWSAAGISAKWRHQKIIMAALAGLTIIGMVYGTRTQLTRWKDSITLFRHTLAVTHNNYMMHHNLGWILTKQNKFDQAAEQFYKALQIRPDFPLSNISLSAILIMRGEYDQALAHIQTALKKKPNDAAAYYNMGLIYEARKQFDPAIDAFQQAITFNNNNADAFYHLGILNRQKGFIGPAIDAYRQAVKLQPDYIMALNNLAWIQATAPDNRFRNPTEAIQSARAACRLTYFKNPVFLDTLAAAYAAAGQFKEARETVLKALDLARSTGQTDIADEISKHLQLYQSEKPYYEDIQPKN